jgi:UDP-glucose 4-epimerase
VKNSIKDCNLVIHLAASLGVVNVERDPVQTLDINLGGTKNVLEACRTNNIKKIIFSSSSEVYGEPAKIPIKENDPITPITTYGISKLASEEYIKS